LVTGSSGNQDANVSNADRLPTTSTIDPNQQTKLYKRPE
jgi:hypothetical protein